MLQLHMVSMLLVPEGPCSMNTQSDFEEQPYDCTSIFIFNSARAERIPREVAVFLSELLIYNVFKCMILVILEEKH